MRASKFLFPVIGLTILVPAVSLAAAPSPRFQVTATIETGTHADRTTRFSLDARLRPIEPPAGQARFVLNATLAAQGSAKGGAPDCAASTNSIFIDGFEMGVTS